ncbi:MAG: hypothetical protein JM58_01295 [Peptococcaceae bacterium BICA1-8]|nr:MAG: hypothetical protein JM58_01295 [Peptococcaceae bacterium BICA1-8]
MDKVTIKDVAKTAGVSIATVSRVINKSYYVSTAVEKKVLMAIEELKYYPNSIARSLKINSTKMIGFLVSDISNNYFITMARALEDVLNRQNYNLIVCSTENQKERELTYLELLKSKKVDALVLNTTGQNDEFVINMSHNIPIICVNRRINNSSFKGDFLDSDNIQGTYMLTKHLLSLGHRKIFVQNGSFHLSTGYERYEGFKKAMAEIGIEIKNDYIFQYEGDFTLESGFQGVAYMMGLKDRPTALVVMNNMMAIGALKYLKLHEINIPEELSIASYGNIENLELMSTQPSIISFDPAAIGTRIGELILERIKDNSLINKEIIYQPQLIKGNGVKSFI